MILRPSLVLNAAHTTPPPTAVAMATIGTYFFAYFMLSVSFSGLMNRTTGYRMPLDGCQSPYQKVMKNRLEGKENR